MSIINCKIYRCSKQDGMYLYIHEDKTSDDLPEELIKMAKELTHTMDLELSPERKLAREDINVVMKNLKEKGYHLQMPPDPLSPNLYRGD
ncbi:MAG: hypothetical protein ACI85N_001548 [Gammaproteobacteria bacterium]|jgi:uncharacterized protein YcgL (UPF0745 family)